MQISFPTLPVKEQNNQKQQNYESKNRVATLALFPQVPYSDVNQQSQNHQTRKFTFSFPQNQQTPIIMQAPPPPSLPGSSMVVSPHSMPMQAPPHVPTKQAMQMQIPQQQIIQQQQQQIPNMILPNQQQQLQQQVFPKQIIKKNEPAQRKAKKERAAIDLMPQKPQIQPPRPQVNQMPQQQQNPQNSQDFILFSPNQPFDLRSMPPPGCFNIIKRGNIPSISFDYQLTQ